LNKLKLWRDENPIKNLESLKNSYYKDFDGSVGLPINEENYLNIKKLILPLGDTYKKDIPKEIGDLTNLNELSIIARNVKNIPNEIFNLPNLKKLDISIDCDYKISSKNLKVLIYNGCKDIMINTLERRIQYKDTVKDEQILNYLEKNDLYVTSKDFGISKDDLYSISKHIASTDEEFSKYMKKFLDKKHKFGYEAFIYAIDNNEKEINDLINFIELDYEITENHNTYVEDILEVAISIVEYFPFKSLDILDNINETYPIVGSLPAETLDLSVNIVYSIAKKEGIKKALEYLSIIEVDHFKLDALEKLVLISSTKDISDLLMNMIKKLESNIKEE
tara:strand:- start:3439 stop:4443 length:1005 start_codon:yes stop_codon:yes gene_type:complete